MTSERRRGRTHLHTDYDHQGCCRGDGKGLVVSKRNAGTLSGFRQDGIGDKKQHHRCVDALSNADEELPLVEEEVELSGLVEFRILQTPLVRNVLSHMRNGGE